MKKTRLISLLSLLLVLVLAISACNPTPATTTAEVPAATDAPEETEAEAEETEAEAEETEAAEEATEAEAADDETPYIAVISKGFQHQFWQVVAKGAEAAAEEYGVEITFEGPPTEDMVDEQVKMLNAALAKQPAALALAALSTRSVDDQLRQALADGIPVIGFDSGVPEAPEGAVHATASTNNRNAGALGAEHMYEAVKEKLAEGEEGSPIRIAVISQDATSESVTGRTFGFVDKMVELVKAGGIETVAVTGHDLFIPEDQEEGALDAATVVIDVGVSSGTQAGQILTTIQALMNKDNVVGIFASNELSANGILDATNEGEDLGDVVAVGFDAGIRQKTAVQEGLFLGSVTQDPFQIGYKAVELAYKAYMGETVEDVDTGAKFYDKDNLSDPSINELVYE